jgi:DNA-binding LacI/PurR family transcriptional regulator
MPPKTLASGQGGRGECADQHQGSGRARQGVRGHGLQRAEPAGQTAVLCAYDLLALGLQQEMTRRRIRMPEDVAIVGYDDIEFAAAAAVPLSSVRQPRPRARQVRAASRSGNSR